MKQVFFILLVLMGSMSMAIGQRMVSGIATNNSGEALIGASVVVKEFPAIGTITDIDGRYSLRVPEGGKTLVVSYVGYTSQEIAIDNQSTINISLEAGQVLDEVVVTAYGIERKRNDLSVSAQKVTGDEVNQVRNNNFINALSGKVAGLSIRTNNNMGGSTNVILRGTKSISGNNQALFVVDGVPVSNSTLNSTTTARGFEGYDYGSSGADINTDDIESITVLKGAAAALYGSRGANGVIIINTKKGKKDNFSVEVNSGLTFGKIDKSTFIEYQNEYGAGYGQDYYDYAPNLGFRSSDLFTPGIESPFVPVTEDGSFGARFDPNLLVYDWRSLDSKSPQYGKPSPWVAAKNDASKFFETSVTSNQSIVISGGGKTTTYKLGFNRNDEKGMMPNSNLAKNMLSLSGSLEPNDKFKFSSSINFTNQAATGRYGSGYGNVNAVTMFRQWWQTNVDILDQKEAFERFRQNATWNPAGIEVDAGPIFWDNPYFVRYINYENDSRNRLFGNVQAQYNLLPELSIIGRIGADMAFDQQEERRGKSSVDLGYYNIYNRSYKEYNYDLLANYNKDLNDDFNLNVGVGTNIRRSYISSIFSETNTDLVVDGLYSISNSSGIPNPPSESYIPVGVDGIFATATLNAWKRLSIDATIRRDQSTTLPEANNTFIYPSISAGYNFTDLVDQSWLSYGKLRASYSEVGNDAPALSVNNVYDKPTAFGTIPFFRLPTVKNNADLKPERTKAYEVGLDMAFLEHRIGFELTYYNASTFDQIIPIQITGATGYTSKYINSGEVNNSGIELIASFVPVRSKDLTWTLNVNFAKNKNEVVSLYDANTKQIVIGTFQNGVSLVARPGQPFGTLLGRGFVLDANGNKVVDEDGYYKSKGASEIGNIQPDWQAGFGSSLRYKNLSFGLLVDAKIGGDIYSLDQGYGQYTGLPALTAGLNDLGNPKRDPIAKGGGVILPGVKEDGTPNDIRVSAENADVAPWGSINAPNENVIYDASYVKLRELNLTYSFDNKLFANSRFVKGVDVSLVGRNLWILYKNLPDADPEEVYSAGNISGHQGGAYPTLRTAGFNIKLRF
ncbi:MAG TPA: SusC/RagA family TonB-linked outer membrane protein [Saprospiraceae bacterium]|mgnify:CR=1 FL=1|nr:SusC/RagA family TonB-linked outer membrane protein [Saprospiraceae bacterium]HRO08436.1 SusC/RagA family TonB-linked outer membrane protein [Saprospiraceae bacterium]HRP41821.1 SusC/RagA family TonB-linked outer membrane protein [Saprospiraceae bacterium]